MLQNVPRNIKVAGVFLLAAIAIVAIGYSIYNQVANAGKIAVTVATTPSDAEVTIDGKKVSQGTIYLTPDHTYNVKVHKDGFQDISQDQHISASNNSILANLLAVSDEAKKWAEAHQDDYLAVEAKGGEAANQRGEAFTDKNPITEVLPYENLIYSIGYRSDPSDKSGNSIIISIDAPEGARNAAVQQIHDLGYDPTQFKIEFNDYENPFAL